MEKKRYANLDLLKTIAIVMVIMLHSSVLNTNFVTTPGISSIIQYAIRIISEGVAIFILVNGFLLINKENFDLKKHLKKILKIFIILIIWSVLLTIASKLIWGQGITISDTIKTIFTTDINNKYTGVLWFLQSLIALYLIFPILKNLHDTNKKVYNYLFILLLINTILVNTLGLVSNLIQTKMQFNMINMFTAYLSKFQILTNRNFLIFFMLGGYLFENKEKFEEKKVRIKWSLIGLGAWIMALLYAITISKLKNKMYASNFNFESVFILLSIIGMYAFTYKYKDNNKWYNNLITCIGKNSLGIYLVHIIIIRLIDKLYVGEITMLYKIAKISIVLIISLIVTLIIKKIPKVKKIIEI